MSFETMENVLKSATGSKPLSIKRESLEEIIRAVAFFQIPKLEVVLASYVTSNKGDIITLSNVLDLWTSSTKQGATQLSLALEQHVLINFESLIYERDLDKVSVDQLKRLLASDDLMITTEMFVLRAIKLWINYDSNNRKDYFDQLLPLMRYQKNVDVSIWCMGLWSSPSDHLLIPFQVKLLRRDVECYSKTKATKDFLYAYEYGFPTTAPRGKKRLEPVVVLNQDARKLASGEDKLGIKARRKRSLKD